MMTGVTGSARDRRDRQNYEPPATTQLDSASPGLMTSRQFAAASAPRQPALKYHS
jgi:hypothetical protein